MPSPIPDTRPGFVSLVGAGPGAPDLITLRGARALALAEVVLYDALLDPGFAALYPKGALALSVGAEFAISSLVRPGGIGLGVQCRWRAPDGHS